MGKYENSCEIQEIVRYIRWVGQGISLKSHSICLYLMIKDAYRFQMKALHEKIHLQNFTAQVNYLKGGTKYKVIFTSSLQIVKM